MPQTTAIDFDDLEQALGALRALCSPAELHGLLLGLIAAGRSPAAAEWLQIAARLGDFGTPGESERLVLLGLREQALASARDEQLGLRLLLPEDDCELGERVEQLALWCQGFLNGFAEGGAQPETDELLHDLAAIANAGLADDEAGDGAEADFHNVSEHVRLIAAQLCWERRPQDGAAAPAADPSRLFRRDTLH